MSLSLKVTVFPLPLPFMGGAAALPTNVGLDYMSFFHQGIREELVLSSELKTYHMLPVTLLGVSDHHHENNMFHVATVHPTE